MDIMIERTLYENHNPSGEYLRQTGAVCGTRLKPVHRDRRAPDSF